jgi:hypothetical protein
MTRASPSLALLVTLAVAWVACSDGPTRPIPIDERSVSATSTHRRLCAVVGPLTKDLAETALCAQATGAGRSDLCGGWVPYYRADSGWDGISDPPPVFAWQQCLQGSLATAAAFADAVDAALLLGARRYEGLVVPDEATDASNTVSSIYAGHGLLTQGYDPGLPVHDYFAAVAAHAEQGLLSPVLFPSRSAFP